MLRNLLLAALALLPVVSAWAEEAQKREMRTVWIATVSNIDWPQTKGSSASVIATQKKQLTDMLPKAEPKPETDEFDEFISGRSEI